jgi:aminoglycoside adenylyltransferase-like protein
MRRGRVLINESLTEFPELNEIVRDLAERAAAILGDNFVGAYLQGSFAVGDADQFSDVDFLIPTHGLITPDQEVQLRVMHAEFPERDVSWAQHLEGSYPPQDELRTLGAVGKTWLYVDNGAREMGWSAHDNTAVTRWSLRERGTVLTGPEPKALVDPVSAHDLRTQALADANRFMATLHKSAVELDNAWLQPYIVATFCRFLHTLDCGEVTSKRQALLWARNHLDPAWSDIIQQALCDRPDPWGRVRQPARPGTLQETLRFAKYGESIAERYSRVR